MILITNVVRVKRETLPSAPSRLYKYYYKVSVGFATTFSISLWSSASKMWWKIRLVEENNGYTSGFQLFIILFTILLMLILCCFSMITNNWQWHFDSVLLMSNYLVYFHCQDNQRNSNLFFPNLLMRQRRSCHCWWWSIFDEDLLLMIFFHQWWNDLWTTKINA